jgi:hypothetical protein
MRDVAHDAALHGHQRRRASAVFVPRSRTAKPKVLMSLKRGELRKQWSALYETVSKASVIAYKQKLREVFAGTGVRLAAPKRISTAHFVRICLDRS